MKYLMYIVRENASSWAEGDYCYKLYTERPADYEDYKRVLVELLETSDSIDDVFRG